MGQGQGLCHVSGSNDRDQPNAFSRSTPPPTTPATSNVIFLVAAYSNSFELTALSIHNTSEQNVADFSGTVIHTYTLSFSFVHYTIYAGNKGLDILSNLILDCLTRASVPSRKKFGERSRVSGNDMVSRLSTAIICFLLVVYAVAALRPFNWQWLTAPNMAQPREEHIWSFPKPGVLQSQTPPPWIATAKELQSLEIELQVRSFSYDQHGPARILTISRDPFHTNLIIAQDRKDLIVRLRTPKTTLRGIPAHRVKDVFAVSEWKHIQVFISSRQLKIEINGDPSYSYLLPKTPLANWDPSYLLAIGNEPTHNRPWQGEVKQALVRVGQMDQDYVSPHALFLPSVLRPPIVLDLIPFKGSTVIDLILNFFGFIPLGFFLALKAYSDGRKPRIIVLSILVLTSLNLELLQLFLPGRHTSTTDLLFNTAGGVVGLFLSNIFLAVGRKYALVDLAKYCIGQRLLRLHLLSVTRLTPKG